MVTRNSNNQSNHQSLTIKQQLQLPIHNHHESNRQTNKQIPFTASIRFLSTYLELPSSKLRNVSAHLDYGARFQLPLAKPYYHESIYQTNKQILFATSTRFLSTYSLPFYEPRNDFAFLRHGVHVHESAHGIPWIGDRQSRSERTGEPGYSTYMRFAHTEIRESVRTCH